MSLKQADIDKIKAYGFDVDKLIAAVKDEKEVDYVVPVFTALTEDQLTTRDNTKLEEGKKLAEPEARKTLVTEVAKRLGVTPKNERIGDLVAEIQAKINATDDTKLKTLQDQVGLLSKDKETLEASLASEKSTSDRVRFDFELMGHLPANRDAKRLRDDERVGLLTKDITFELVDGKRVAKRNGEVIKDPKTHAPLPVADVVKQYAGERGWDKEIAPGTGGRGGGNEGGGGGSALKKYSQAQQQWKQENPDKNPVSQEFMNYVNKLAKDDPTFDMYS